MFKFYGFNSKDLIYTKFGIRVNNQKKKPNNPIKSY